MKSTSKIAAIVGWSSVVSDYMENSKAKFGQMLYLLNKKSKTDPNKEFSKGGDWDVFYFKTRAERYWFLKGVYLSNGWDYPAWIES